MTRTSTTIRSYPAAIVASLCAMGTLAILFDDVIRGGKPNIQHLISVVTLIATLYAGHAIWTALGSKPFAALGAALIFAAGTGYIVVTSAGRTAHVMADKAIVASEANARYAKAKARADKLEASYETLKAAAASECASGDGRKCSGKSLTAAAAKLDYDQARIEAGALRPEVASSDYLQGASLIAAFTGDDKGKIEAKLLLGIPFLLAVILEFGVMVFSHLAMDTVVVETVPAQTALTFERPLSEKETGDLKKLLVSEDAPVAPRVLTAKMVKDLKADGMKHSDIAAMFGLNQGRVSELMTGKRDMVVLG